MSLSFLKNHAILNRALTGIVIFVVIFSFARYVMTTLDSRNFSIDFGFLGYPANFDIGNSVLSFSGSDSYGKALFIGFLNTIKAAIACIVLATVVGTFLGVLRLSSNPLLRGCVGFLIELFRNVPPLLQLFTWSAIIQFSLPLPRNAWEPVTGMVLSNRGIWFPFLALSDDHSWGAIAGFGLIGIAAILVLWRMASRGMDKRSWALALAVFVAGAAVVVLSGSLVPDLPEKRGFNFRGGLAVTPEFAALVISLTLYTSGYIAEIVRGAVLSVPAGQSEAGAALGFRQMPIMRLVILPQAVRIAIPPMTSQYINVTKSTSLAVAVGYSDIVSIGNTIMNQSGRAVEIIAIFILAYLFLNLVISEIMNRLNKRMLLI